jgi:hypothetical protein
MADAFSPEQLAQLEAIVEKGVRKGFADAGLRIDDGEHEDEAREDFRFLRRMRMTWDGAAKRTGTFVLLALLGIVATITSLGFWQWVGRGH